ncbi:MAG: hypothetical protein IKU60_05050 [Clostridia bacterium]|nr:hypothetical protein [Clostridia bacterium]
MPKNKLINLLIYSYIALPFLIFSAGFLKWYFAIPVSVCTILAIALSVRDCEGYEKVSKNRFTPLCIAGGLFIIIAVVLLSGIGNVLWQNNDHATRNTIFDILVNFSWPPEYIKEGGNEVALVYYIGFWLPSALIGKLTTLQAGYIFQIIWAAAGLCILWYLLCVIHKKVVIYPLVIFLFFGGMDIIGHSFVELFYNNLTNLQKGAWAFPGGSAITTHIEWWAGYFQYSSNTTQLFWVFNQCLPVWIATIVILLEKNNKNLVFIMGTTLISSTLPFVGLIPIFVWCALCDHKGDLLNRPFTDNFGKSFFSLFTYQNVTGGGLSGIISFLYLIGNIASTTQSDTTTTPTSSAQGFSVWTFIITIVASVAIFTILKGKSPITPVKLVYLIPSVIVAAFLAVSPMLKIEYYLLFVIFEFGILSLLLLPSSGKSALFFITIASLLIIPFFKVGKSIDFCMRASIPLLVVLCLFSLKAVKEYFDEEKQLLSTLLCVALMLGALTPVKEIARTIEATFCEIEVKGGVANDSKTVSQVFGGKNFTGRTEDNFFFEVLAK